MAQSPSECRVLGGCVDDTSVTLALPGRMEEGSGCPASAERMMLWAEGERESPDSKPNMSLRKGTLCFALVPHAPTSPPVTPQKPQGGGKIKAGRDPNPTFKVSCNPLKPWKISKITKKEIIYKPPA